MIKVKSRGNETAEQMLRRSPALEALNPMGEWFGTERLISRCALRSDIHGPELLSDIFKTIDEFTDGFGQQDDMAATVFHYADAIAMADS